MLQNLIFIALCRSPVCNSLIICDSYALPSSSLRQLFDKMGENKCTQAIRSPERATSSVQGNALCYLRHKYKSPTGLNQQNAELCFPTSQHCVNWIVPFQGCDLIRQTPFSLTIPYLRLTYALPIPYLRHIFNNQTLIFQIISLVKIDVVVFCYEETHAVRLYKRCTNQPFDTLRRSALRLYMRRPQG